MNPQELRIGNWLYMGEVERESTVSAYQIYNISRKDGVAEYYKLIKPIPLTKEWLFKLGFKSDAHQQEFELNTINLDCEYTDKGEWVVFLKGQNIKPIESKNEYVCHYYPKAEIKYVHQLQNLYFALIGEELVVE